MDVQMVSSLGSFFVALLIGVIGLSYTAWNFYNMGSESNQERRAAEFRLENNLENA